MANAAAAANIDSPDCAAKCSSPTLANGSYPIALYDGSPVDTSKRRQRKEPKYSESESVDFQRERLTK